MGNKYLIKEAAKLVDVEPHVLRYWEEELDMRIKRNDMGHRYYDEQDIRILKKIKELKDRGIQLKAIHELVQKMYDILENGVPAEDASKEVEADFTSELVNTVTQIGEDVDDDQARIVDFKLVQFQSVMSKIVGNSIKENIKPISQAVTAETTEQIAKQMDVIMREQDERAEERYRRLDTVIREMQQTRREIAAAETTGNKKKHFFGKKNKYQCMQIHLSFVFFIKTSYKRLQKHDIMSVSRAMHNKKYIDRM